MKVLSFKYTKADGSVSRRNLAVMIKPNTMFEGIDISSLEAPDQYLFAKTVNEAYENYLSALDAAKAEFDLTFDYRRFDPKKMTDVIEEEI
jgi:hypothetical protein